MFCAGSPECEKSLPNPPLPFLTPAALPSFPLSLSPCILCEPRAINNGLLDTYQLKSLDGLLESDLRDLAILKDSKGKFHVTLKFFLEEASTNQSADAITLPQDDNDNFAMRVPYDRVIRCLGWNFDFSIFNK